MSLLTALEDPHIIQAAYGRSDHVGKLPQEEFYMNGN